MKYNYELEPHHYCALCKHSSKHDIDICDSCDYNLVTGHSKWEPIKMYDTITKPKHYMLMDNLEVRDVLAALVDKLHKQDSQLIPDNALFESDYVQALQYLMRFMQKNGKEDLLKARWFLNKMIDAYEN